MVKHVYESGFQRDSQNGKPRFDLLLDSRLPYGDQYLTRLAVMATRGAELYGVRNHEKVTGASDELEHFQASAFRHFMKWMCGATDEDHAAATTFNILMYEHAAGRARQCLMHPTD